MDIFYRSSSRTPNSVVLPSVNNNLQSAMDLSWKARNGRTQTLLTDEQMNIRLGEVAGGITAECAAVACCPCALLNLAVLAFVKLPAGLSKRAWRKAKRKHRKRSKAVHGKVEVPYEDSDTEDSSLASSQDELLTPIYNVNALVMDRTCVSTENFWEAVVGKSYVGFWRNHSFRE